MKKLTEEHKQEIRELVAYTLGYDTHEFSDDSHFAKDLGADSLDHVEIIMDTERILNMMIPDAVAEKIHTVGELFDAVENL